MRFKPENVQPRWIVERPVLAEVFLAGLLLSKQGAAIHDGHLTSPDSRLPEELSPLWACPEFRGVLLLLVSHTLGKAGFSM